jgi:hypothetical protein
MNRDKILAMEAGEELDKLVAEALGDVFETAENSKCYRHFQKNPAYGGWAIPAPTSTDISVAWQVVEKLRSMEDGEGNPLLCCLTIYSDHDLCWDISWNYSELSNKNDGHKTHRLPSSYDELPEAICKAALLIKYSIKNG